MLNTLGSKVGGAIQTVLTICKLLPLILRKTKPNMPRPYKVPLYQIVPGISIFGGIFVVVNQLLFAGTFNSMLSICGIIITLIGLPVYNYMSRKNKFFSKVL